MLARFILATTPQQPCWNFWKWGTMIVRYQWWNTQCSVWNLKDGASVPCGLSNWGTEASFSETGNRRGFAGKPWTCWMWGACGICRRYPVGIRIYYLKAQETMLHCVDISQCVSACIYTHTYICSDMGQHNILRVEYLASYQGFYNGWKYYWVKLHFFPLCKSWNVANQHSE